MKTATLIFMMLSFLLIGYNKTKESKSNNQTNILITKTDGNKQMEKKEKEQIEKLLSAYKTILNTSNSTNVVNLYTKDGVFMPSGAPSAIGTVNIKKAYEYVFSQIQLNIEFYIDEILVENNLAFATTTSKGTTLIHATGDIIPEENRELFVFEKENGKWKIARYMFNKTK